MSKVINPKTEALFAQIQKGKEEIDAIKKELASKVQKTFHDLSKELFILYPELKSFTWTQYTPYWNDGEECTFEVNTDYMSFNGYNEDYDKKGPSDWIDIEKNSKSKMWNKDGDWREVRNPNYNPYYKEIINSVKQFLKKFEDDDFLSIFDDHVEVTVTADGVKTKKYEHD